ncbi:hypothetical protein MXD59_15175 [Frankia sp. Ag45/Mut15]|uniref:Uncharacterized protein n=1 Tax=Frankia umida TaxID=573489 RepID=A0ABT0JZX7_9ACTN|nr:hypothetical protein [Frankia umida]MCK9877099.1 hypothetical protein [Frankia umida]
MAFTLGVQAKAERIQKRDQGLPDSTRERRIASRRDSVRKSGPDSSPDLATMSDGDFSSVM